MNRIGARRKIIFALAFAALLVPASAGAALPKAKSKRIVVPSSIGGVELRDRITEANRTWGGDGKCDFSLRLKTCVYASADERKGRAEIDAAVQKQVSSFAIEAGRDEEGDYVFEGGLTRFRTSEGIGLGDPGKRIKKAYPEAIKTAGKTGYLIPGPGKSYMTVQTLGGSRITAIAVLDGDHQG